MKASGHIYLSTRGQDQDILRRVVNEAAKRCALRVRTSTVAKRQLRQIELIDASVAIAISLFGSVAAPSLITFVSEIASRLRGKDHSLVISAGLAEAIAKEVVTRYTEPGVKVRLMSLSELAKGKGFKLLLRQRDKTYTVRLNLYGQLESCIRR